MKHCSNSTFIKYDRPVAQSSFVYGVISFENKLIFLEKSQVLQILSRSNAVDLVEQTSQLCQLFLRLIRHDFQTKSSRLNLEVVLALRKVVLAIFGISCSPTFAVSFLIIYVVKSWAAGAIQRSFNRY